VRFVSTVSELQDAGAFTTVQSICQADLTSAMDGVLTTVADMVRAVSGCRYDTPPPRDVDGLVDCEVLVELPSSGTPTSCAQLPTVEPTPVRIEMEDDGPHDVCRMRQLGVPAMGPGWYLDDFSADAQASCGSHGRLAFTSGSDLPRNVRLLSFDCHQPIAEGSICDPSVPDACASDTEPGLFCHPERYTCVRPCSRRSDCGPARDHWHCVEGWDQACGTTSSEACYCQQLTCTPVI